MSDREAAFEAYMTALGGHPSEVERENVQADFNAGWNAARGAS